MPKDVVKVDVTSLEKLAQRLARPEAMVKEMAESAIKTAGAELLRRAMMKTPRVTTNLARRWTDHETPQDQLAKEIPIEQFIKKEPVEQKGNSYFLTISNSTEYAPYVEYGHRTAKGHGWAKGHFMLTQSVPEVEHMLPGIVDQKVKEYFGDLFSG